MSAGFDVRNGRFLDVRFLLQVLSRFGCGVTMFLVDDRKEW